MAKITEVNIKTVKSNEGYGSFEYEMSKLMAKEILATRKGAEQNMQPQAFLCQVVNEEFEIKGHCVKVITV